MEREWAEYKDIYEAELYLNEKESGVQKAPSEVVERELELERELVKDEDLGDTRTYLASK